jgi:thiamine kinase-like enzyme
LLQFRAVKDGLAGTEALQKFESFGKDPSTLFSKVCDGTSTIEPAIVTHGDAWATNFLFRGEEIMIIDFQVIR